MSSSSRTGERRATYYQHSLFEKMIKGSGSTLELNLLENGLDFILSGVDELYKVGTASVDNITNLTISEKGYKYGTLHIFSGFQLLLKECLYRYNEELIYKGTMEEVRKKKLQQNGVANINTINLDEALKRLKDNLRVTFSKSDLQIIKDMQLFRNIFEHSEVSMDKGKLFTSIELFLLIIDNFLEMQLGLHLEDWTETSEVSIKIKRIKTVTERLQAKIAAEQHSVIKQMWINLANNRETIMDGLNQLYSEEGGAVNVLLICPSCKEQTVFAIGEFTGFCSNEYCQNMSQVVECIRCGKGAIENSGELTFCEDCSAYVDSAFIFEADK